jgi:excisionase family DNA binding protein
MAKMFYTVEEAAEKLGVAADEVRQMASDHKLQQFRDRDKLMFKREEVDNLAKGKDPSADTDGSGELTLSDSGDTDAIDLADSTADAAGSTAGGSQTPQAGQSGQQSGIDVFDKGEVDEADPMAQTQVTSSQDEDELATESVGSGSGLLDLTRESDDTSLGAELLDEIYPSSGEGSDAKMEGGIGSSGVFEQSMSGSAIDAATESMIGGSGMSGSFEGAPERVVYETEPFDPAWNGLTLGAMIGVTTALILSLVISAHTVVGLQFALTETIASNIWLYGGVMLGGTLVLAVIGMVLGKVLSK